MLKLKNKIIFFLAFIILFICGLYLSKILFQDSSKIISRTQLAMGTFVEIKILSYDEQLANRTINEAITEIKRIDKIFSTYNNKSTVWGINYSKDKMILLDSEIFDFILICDSIWKITNGAFDPSLGALTSAWGFESESPKLPTEDLINQALINSGWSKINLLKNGLRKDINIKLDFSSIAKGYAVDKAIEKIKSTGVKIALVNIGGEVKGIGKNWNVGIKHPRMSGLFIENININEYGIATSGDYENYFIENGKRYNHIINPKTGYSAVLCQSVSIINKSDLFADALSTACFVLGAKKSLELIEKLEDTECLIIDINGNKYESKGFDKFRIKQK